MSDLRKNGNLKLEREESSVIGRRDGVKGQQWVFLRIDHSPFELLYLVRLYIFYRLIIMFNFYQVDLTMVFYPYNSYKKQTLQIQKRNK